MSYLPRSGPLLTDLYELTMAAGYFDHHIQDNAVFSLFIRDYPADRNYFVAAGLADVLAEFENYTFTESDLSYLKQTGFFTDAFIDYLKDFRFTGTVRAMPEGTVFFRDEPVIEVSAPLIQAQIIETLLINTIGFQTLIATKAARCLHAGEGRSLIDFSARRTHGGEASLKVARSSYLAGFAGTSNVLAGKLYGIPVSGTMAHSFVTAFDTEIEAFRAFAETYPENSVLLIDTYDTIQGAENAVKIAGEMAQKGRKLIGVRLDSGDMVDLSRRVRQILDNAGLKDVKIFASSGFDEHKIARVIEAGAKIDAFGVGTKLGVSADAPYFDIVYKMVHFRNRDIRKLSPGKVNLAGEKQVFRKTDQNGMYVEDIIGLKDEAAPAGCRPLLETVMEGGERTLPETSLEDIRNRVKTNLSKLNEPYTSLTGAQVFPVKISERLRQVQSN
ncbi:MAG: nicotinate phosphoribosyltransferase [Desulfobacterales bacterium]|nr:nicotinate phosphoribosyltransferase [Desulfobacterales bacterium]